MNDLGFKIKAFARSSVAHWHYLFLVLVTVLFQLPHLHLGHYWDEAWVYAPAIRAMAKGLPSILPDAIPLDLSRGHPLLFQFLGGLWAKIFGTSNVSLHCFALAISASLLLIIKGGLTKLIGSWPAFLTAILVATCPMFLAQSAMLYPEMLLTFGLLIAIIYYALGHRLYFAIGLAVALLSKESALVFVIGFLLIDLSRLVFDKRSLTWFLAYTLPILVILYHPLSLFTAFGWFLYPEHTGYIRFDLNEIKYFVRHVYQLTFEEHGRGWILYPVLALAAISIRLRNYVYNILLLGVGFAAYKILIWKWTVPDFLFPIVMFVAILVPIVIWWFWRQNKAEVTSAGGVYLVTYLIAIGFVVFSAMNFFTNRYLLALVVLLMVASAIIVFKSSRIPSTLKYIFIGAFICVNLTIGVDPSKRGENNIGIFNDLQVSHNMAKWMVENAEPTDLVCADFVISNYLTNPSSGYVSEENDFERWFEKMCRGCDSAKYIITSYTNDCPDMVQHEIDKRNSLVFTDTLGSSWVSVYKNTTR